MNSSRISFPETTRFYGRVFRPFDGMPSLRKSTTTRIGEYDCLIQTAPCLSHSYVATVDGSPVTKTYKDNDFKYTTKDLLRRQDKGAADERIARTKRVSTKRLSSGLPKHR